MPLSSPLINALDTELPAAAGFCRANGLGVEITAFAWPAALEEGFDDLVRRHEEILAGIAPRTLHGPFLDLYQTSPDPAIVAVCRARHLQAMEAAQRLGATTYVAHLNSIPLIRNRGYRTRFAEATARFWVELADNAAGRGLTIALENLWEPDPALQQAVVRAAGHSAVQASFDNGHALVFSRTPAAEWIETLGPDLTHCHLHDNDGEYDQHGAIGDGTEDWPALLAALRCYAPEAIVVLESDRLEVNRRSLAALRELW